MKKIGLLLVIIFFAKIGFSQKGENYSNTNKGYMYVLWGWNRAAYTKSNISFKGKGYDFKLLKVAAKDRPTKFSIKDYLQVDRISIPQTNFRIGYFVRKNLAITLGFDHMKYVMTQNQTVKMKGVITKQGQFEGSYNGDKKLTADFLAFEHTDGLNYINIEAEKYFNIYHAASNNFNIDAMFGVGAGILMPRTDITLLNYERSDEFHVSGYGLNIKAGIQATLFKHLTIKFENKNGFINMPDINLHKDGTPGLAKQSFFFTAIDGMIGYSFTFKNKKAKKSKSK